MTRTSRSAPLKGLKSYFVLVGGSAFMLGSALVEALVWSGISPYIAQVPTFIAGATYTWWLNRRLTFDVGCPPTLPEYGRYIVSSALGMAVSLSIFSMLIWAGLRPFVALGGGTLAGLVANYFGYSRYAFVVGQRHQG